MRLSYVRSWLVGAAGYAAGLVVTLFAVSSLIAAQGADSAPTWSQLLLVVPPLVCALAAVLVLRLPVRPPWYAGAVAVLGGVVLAVVAGVLTLVQTARYVDTPAYGALVYPVLATTLLGLGVGLLRRRAWVPPETPEAGYTTSATEVSA